MARPVAIVTLLLGFFVALLFGAGCHDTNPQPGPTNTLPILDGMSNMVLRATESNGLLFTVNVPNNGENTTFYLSHVWGTPYEMGKVQAIMYQKAGVDLKGFITGVWNYYLVQIEDQSFLQTLPVWLRDWIANFGFETALELTEAASYEWTGTYFWEEMQGLADGCGMDDTDYHRLMWIHMLPGLSEGKCSMIGAWGDALDPTGSSKLLQLRALDWDMSGPFRDFPAIVVYHPNKGNGHPFFNLGVGGFIGGLTGVSATQLGISEIGVDFPDSTFGSESRIGVPFVFLLRDILQFDKTIDEALNRIVNTHRTTDLILGVGDGKVSEFRGVAYSSGKVTIMDDTNLLPNNATWHPRIKDVVYWGMDWICPGDNLLLSQQIKSNYGKLSGPLALSQLTPVEESGSNHLAYYDLTNMLVWVSFAAPHSVTTTQPNAYARQFTSFDVNKLFAVKKPSSD